jgi:hypothetical protein
MSIKILPVEVSALMLLIVARPVILGADVLIVSYLYLHIHSTKIGTNTAVERYLDLTAGSGETLNITLSPDLKTGIK